MRELLGLPFAKLLNTRDDPPFDRGTTDGSAPHDACKSYQRRSVSPLLAMLFVFAAVATFSTLANAQVRFGTVLGNVSDSSGAMVPGATVKLTSLGTNETRTMQTGSGGTYAFPNLNPGLYRVDIEMAGFKRFTQDQVQVQVDVSTRVDAALQVGDVSQSVVVTGEAAVLQTDSASLGTVISQREVSNLPLNGRNVNNMLTLVPGVVAQGGTYGNAVGNQAAGARTNAIGWGNYAIGGGFGNQSRFYVDGVAINGPANNLTTYIPSQDTVQEFRVVTNNVSAEYGNYAGGVVNITTKSGTNQFHGSAYEYLRNKVLNANNFFSNRQGLDRAPLVQNQFGFTLGGPVRKDKVFFFFGFERQVFHTATLSLTTVPTAAMRSGDFSAPGLAPIYDQSQAGNPQFQYNGVLNVIDPARLDPVAVKLFNIEYPFPNSPGLVNNYVVQMATGGVNNQFNPRVDLKLSDSDSMFIRYGHWKADSLPYDAWGKGTQGQGKTGIITNQAILGDTHIFNPTTILDLRLSYLQAFEHECAVSSGVDLTQFEPGWVGMADQLAGAPHGMAEAERLLLPGIGDLAGAHDRPADHRHFARLAALGENAGKLDRMVEMVLDHMLATAGDENELLNAGLSRLLDGILDDRFVDDREHLFGHRLGRRQDAGAHAGDGQNGFADGSGCGHEGTCRGGRRINPT